ncbi:MAG: aminotransferase class IV [Phycisphaerales bacterium]|jgi:branched-chain amino acid aminotransferase
MNEKIFLNDKLTNANSAKVSVTDGGLLYGMGLFETMRSYNGVVFALDDHLDRLSASTEKLSIINPYKKKFLKEAIYKTLEGNGLSDARIRLTLTSGSVSADQQKPTLMITATELKPYPPEYYQKGVMVILCPYRQNPNDPTTGHKTTSYMPRMLGLKFAQKYKATEALWFTTDNRLAEGCISNVFVVKDSAIYTPAANTPVLPGIARKTVLKLAAEYSLRCSEKDLHIDDLLDADEVFITNVIMQVMPVIKVEKHDINAAKVGAVTKELGHYYDKFVQASCGKKNEGK